MGISAADAAMTRANRWYLGTNGAHRAVGQSEFLSTPSQPRYPNRTTEGVDAGGHGHLSETTPACGFVTDVVEENGLVNLLHLLPNSLAVRLSRPIVVLYTDSAWVEDWMVARCFGIERKVRTPWAGRWVIPRRSNPTPAPQKTNRRWPTRRDPIWSLRLR